MCIVSLSSSTSFNRRRLCKVGRINVKLKKNCFTEESRLRNN